MRGGGAGRVIPLLCIAGSSRRTPRQLSSLKLKLLHCSFIAIFLFLLVVCADRWCRPSHTEAATPPPCPTSQGYTVLINTWNRNDLLSQSVAHYASCAGAKSIRVVWSQPGQPPDALRIALQREAAEKSSRSCGSGSCGVDLRFDVNEEDSLNNRFKPPTEGPGTDGAVFSVDDDVLIPCASVELAFAAWRSAPASMVGFVPRMHWPDENAAGVEGKRKRHRYGGWWSVWWTGTYSMVLSKAAFFHAHYLHLYTHHMPSSIRDYVTKHRNCEDIAMSFLVANATAAPPIWVKASLLCTGDGIRTEGWEVAEAPAGGAVLALPRGLRPLSRCGAGVGRRRKKKHEIKGPIKTLVILVMENRSFDHMLGWLHSKGGRADIDGLTGREFNRLNASDPSSPEIFVSAGAAYVDSDPGHSFQAIREQIFGSEDTSAVPAPMSGFAQQAESMGEGMASTVMRGFAPEAVPVFTALAEEFAVFDRWFASVPTSTQPNRFYVHSATSHGASSNVRRDLIHGFPQKTIFDSLDEDGLSFGVYYQNIPAVLFFKSLRKLKHLVKFHNYKKTFKIHARQGRLPNYVVIEQHYFDVKLSPANDDHPSHDVARGQRLVKEVYETLRASPQWNETALLITYDEHGGFYDHVPTPVTGVPNPDGIIGPDPFYFKFDRLGVRVPTILVSPWIDKRTVIHEPKGPIQHSQFEHSSVPATVKKMFNLNSNYLTKRDAWAGTFESYFYLRKTPRTDCPEKLPNAKPLRPFGPREDKVLSEFQLELIQLASQLNGDHVLNTYPDIGKGMSVGQANRYANDAVARFVEAGRAALMAGANESAIVTMRPALTSRSAGCDSNDPIQSI